MVPNNDYKLERMDELARPRPGHGDLCGSIKYLGTIRGVLERASARETTMRVAAGALARQLLAPLGITAFGYVVEVGDVKVKAKPGTLAEQRALRDSSAVYSLNPDQDDEIKSLIDKMQKAGNTLGGVVEVRVEGLPFGLGSHAQWDRKLDGRLARAVMSVQAMKGVEIGMGFEMARRPGSEVHDPIEFDARRKGEACLGFTRPTNNAGGLEAGMTNAQPLVIRVAKKPISTLARPLASVDMLTKQADMASYERSDVCAIAAASCILENVVAFEIADAVLEKFSGDSLEEIEAHWNLFHALARKKLNIE
jgi:chorismate synthase